MGIAPSGRLITLTETAILRIANGKVVGHWVESDRQDLMEHLGAAPGSAKATS